MNKKSQKTEKNPAKQALNIAKNAYHANLLLSKATLKPIQKKSKFNRKIYRRKFRSFGMGLYLYVSKTFRRIYQKI